MAKRPAMSTKRPPATPPYMTDLPIPSIATYRTVEMHAGGQPVRLVLDGFPEPCGASVLEKRHDAAAVGPLPRAVKAAGELGVARKAQPRCSNGTAAPTRRASPSRSCRAQTTVTGPRRCSRRSSGRSAPPVGMASISSVHWSDGGAIDLDRIAVSLKTRDARFVIDATHGVGVMHIDVRTLDPDFLVFPTYKWVLGPYGRAFLYVAKRWQNGTSIEQAASQRRALSSERTPYMRDTAYVTTARRYDMGERDHFISLEMASVGMEMVAQWGAMRSANGCAC